MSAEVTIRKRGFQLIRGCADDAPPFIVIEIVILARTQPTQRNEIAGGDVEGEQSPAVAVRFFDEIVGQVVAITLLNPIVPAHFDESIPLVIGIFVDGTTAIDDLGDLGPR